MIKLLLLTCGTNACYHIAKTIKKHFSDYFYIIGCDINKEWLIPTQPYLDEFFQTPFSSDENYYSFILKICETSKIDWILPSFDSDQFLFSGDNQDLIKLGVKSFGISKKLDFYKDKIVTNKFLESIGIPVPKFFTREELIDEKKYFVKPIHGVGSIGVGVKKGFEIKNAVDVTEYIIQEICSEPEYTLECFSFNKKIYSICRERIASKAGVCTKTRIFKKPELQKYAQILAENVELPYIFNMQFMRNPAGEYVCTDLNLRTAGGMSLSYAAGWDEVSAIANIMLKKDERTILQTVDKDIEEQYVVRAYEDIVTKQVRKRIAFDLDGTLLDSRERHKIVMDDVLKKFGINLKTDDLVSFKSEGHNNIEWLVSKKINEKTARQINEEWISSIEQDKYLKNDILYSRVKNVLEDLSKDNELYLVTARNNKEGCLKQLKNCGIEQYFKEIEIVDSCKETSRLKTEVLRNYQIDCLVGDTESDCKAAEQAGCKFYTVDYGFRSNFFLQRIGVDIIPNLDILNSVL